MSIKTLVKTFLKAFTPIPFNLEMPQYMKDDVLAIKSDWEQVGEVLKVVIKTSK